MLEVTTLGPLIGKRQKKYLKVLNLKPNKDLSTVIQLYEDGKLKPYIDGIYPLKKVPDLLTYFSQGKHRGKVIIKM